MTLIKLIQGIVAIYGLYGGCTTIWTIFNYLPGNKISLTGFDSISVMVFMGLFFLMWIKK